MDNLAGKFIKHDNAMDVCFEVIGYDGLDAFLYTWNMGQTSAYPIGENVRIPAIKLLDNYWKVCNNAKQILDDGKSLREGEWTPLNG
jgi:hypothetical protein